MERKRIKSKTIAIYSILSVILVLSISWTSYVMDYYKADDVSNQLLDDKTNIIIKDNLTFFSPVDGGVNLDTVIIFYPGGKVEHKAYVPLLYKLSELGVSSVLIDMPYNLAVFNINAADSLYEYFPNTKNFYIAGHSLGGAMSSIYADKNSNKLKGMILLGAYPVNEPKINTLAIYGSLEDGWDKSKLTDNIIKEEITGGNHAQFGNYGIQKGDAVATISREEQQDITISSIIDFIYDNK